MFLTRQSRLGLAVVIGVSALVFAFGMAAPHVQPTPSAAILHTFVGLQVMAFLMLLFIAMLIAQVPQNTRELIEAADRAVEAQREWEARSGGKRRPYQRPRGSKVGFYALSALSIVFFLWGVEELFSIVPTAQPLAGLTVPPARLHFATAYIAFMVSAGFLVTALSIRPITDNWRPALDRLLRNVERGDDLPRE